MTDEQIKVAKETAAKLAKSFIFPGFDKKDVEQQSMLLIMQMIEKGKYDPDRPFVNFIYKHLRNRLFNHKRDKWVKYVKYKVADVSQLSFEPLDSRDMINDKIEQMETEDILNFCPVSLRSTLLRTIFKCKVSASKKSELKEWLKNHAS